MPGPVLGFEFLLLIAFFGFLIFLLFYTIRKRYSLKKSIPTGVLFLVLITITVYAHYRINRNKYEASKNFLGDYKLENLDGKECKNCKVRLKDGYTYDIIANDEVVGHGKWDIGTAIDIPGPFLKVQNGPHYVMWESDRLIDYIDRRQNK
jgi:4-amino-4-deoxy-L-arabinose transferase-like glycosyltransferase